MDDKSIAWEFRDKEITGHVFEGNGVYVIRKLHQSNYKYRLLWKDYRDHKETTLQESDHLLSMMNWCVEHWSLSDDVLK